MNKNLTTEDKIALAIGAAYAKELNDKVFRACADECAAKILTEAMFKNIKGDKNDT